MRSLPKSWASTLSLPKSSFPSRSILWDRYVTGCSDDLYAWQRNRHGEEFTLQDGPPYANGQVHIGHALNKILKDITCRFQVSQGKVVNFVPGWDCHGLPIELKALQRQRDLGIQDEWPAPVSVRKAARELAEEAVQDQKRSFRKWGIMADWGNAWKTMDQNFEIQQLNVFRKLVQKGLIYRKFRPVYWSPSSRTALAEAELEYNEDHVSTAAFVRYPLKLPQRLSMKLGEGAIRTYATIWTTTPWTLPANSAIGVHSDIRYAVVESHKYGLLLVAESRVSELQEACGEALELRDSINGSDLLGVQYEDFVFNQSLPVRQILHADFVTEDSGTGLIHLAPGHGIDDYELCQRHGLPTFAPLDDRGRFTAFALENDPSVLLGKEVLGAGNAAVLRILTRCEMLLGQHTYKHRYPYDWRSKQPVILRATEQWFADIGQVQETAELSLDMVKFIPESGKERLKGFLRSRKEWCISRQRAWGVPIPALYHKDTGTALLTESSVSHIISVIENRGIDSWWTDEASEPAWTPTSLRDNTGKTPYLRGQDTMDVWFDSGTSWTQTRTKDLNNQNTADIYLEGTDQHRGWFQSSLLTKIAQQDDVHVTGISPKAPYKTLITHGFTLDKNGRKMSKSVGNIVSPDEIMKGSLLGPVRKKQKDTQITKITSQDALYDSMGPDALRLWVASCDYTRDVIVSQTVLKAINGILSKYRITFKMLLGLLADCIPSGIAFGKLDIIHQIVLTQLSVLEATARNHYQRFEYNKVIAEVNKFVSTDLSACYIESIKDAVYADTKKEHGLSSRQMAQNTLLYIFTSLQQLLAPITPFLIEETWDHTPEQIKAWQGYPFHRRWGDKVESPVWVNVELKNDLPILVQANAAVKSAQEMARREKKMGSSLQSFVVLQVERPEGNTASSVWKVLTRYRNDLESLFVVSKVDVCLGPAPSEIDRADWVYRSEFEIDGRKVFVHVYTPQRSKCIRCWRYAAPITINKQVTLCDRCDVVVENLRIEKPELFESKLANRQGAII